MVISPTRQQVIKYWCGKNGVRKQWPASQPAWPDAEDPERIVSACRGVVCDVGCGVGRMASLFAADKYVGVDINDLAIKKACEDNPVYTFNVCAWTDTLPEADTYLFHTVLLHVPDTDLLEVLKPTTGKARVVIMEYMNRMFRGRGDGFALNRDPKDYSEALLKIGKSIVTLAVYPSRFAPYSKHMLIGESKI